MGIPEKTAEWAESDELAGDSPADQLAALNSHVRYPAVFWRIYAFHFAVAIAALVYSIALRNYRIAIVGAGCCIRPAATWVAFSDRSEAWKATFAKAARILRGAFVVYCIYLAMTALRG